MTEPVRSQASDLSETDDPGLAEKVAWLIDRLRRGERIDLSSDDSPHTAELRRLLPTLRMMGELAGPAVQGDDLGSLGDFRILREAGRGGMGVVYEAVQVSLGRRVALKVLPDARALDPRQIQRFQVEAQAAASLHHPGIVPVYAVGSERGIPYYAMQFIEGQDLARAIEGWAEEAAATPGRIRDRARTVAELGRQAAEALTYAHAHDVLHRDIKPSNLLVDAADHLWITDFGLARIKGELDLTRTGDHLGTPRFMSPEQALGRRVPPDGRTDIYALGATLYELLTLRPAFESDDRIGLLRRILEEEPTPPRRIDPRIPVDLETIILKSMAKDPAERYATAADLAADLQRFLGNRPILARRPTFPQRAVKWARRHRALVASTGTMAVIATVGMVVAMWQYTTSLKRYNVALQAQITRADNNAAEANRQRRLAERRLLESQLALAQRAIEIGEFPRAREILRTAQPLADRSDPRAFAWRAVWRAAHRVIAIAEEDPRPVPGLFASPDGTTLASIDPARHAIELYDRATGRFRGTLAAPDPIASSFPPHFSPEGDRLVANAADGSAWWIWDIATGRLRARLTTVDERPVWWLELLAGGRFVASHSADPSSHAVLFHLDADPSAGPRRMATLSEAAQDWTCSSDRRVVAIREPDRLVFLDALSGKPRCAVDRSRNSRASTLEGGIISWDGEAFIEFRKDNWVVCHDTATGGYTSFRADAGWSRDRGPYILSGGTLVLIDSEKGTITLRSRGDPLSEEQLASVPESERRMTYRAQQGRSSERRIHRVRSHTIRPELPEGPARIDCYVSPDETRLAVTASAADGAFQPVTLWDPVTGGRIATCPDAHIWLSTVSFTPDSRGLILQYVDEAWLWRLDEPDAVAGHSDEAWAVAFSPDGTILASGSDDTTEPNTIKLWDPSSGRLVRAWSGGKGTVAALAFAPGGRVLASAHVDKEDNIRLWDVATGQLLATLSGHTDRARTVAFAPSGAILASAGSDGTIHLWDAATRSQIRSLVGHEGAVQEVAFAPDGRTLVSVGHDGLHLWDVATGQQRCFRGDKKLMTVAFAPDGATLATADEAGRIRIHDGRSSMPRLDVPLAVSDLNSLAFSPDGRLLAAAGHSGSIHVLDPSTGEAWPSLEGHKAQINGLAFSPDGGTLASVSHDGAVRLWHGGPDAPPQLARDRNHPRPGFPEGAAPGIPGSAPATIVGPPPR